ncbi:hypothetical protein Pyrde_0858 [Pyrodictium delaneyi]|uniref:DUF1156 domain-containing protein n=1 Tax=Pyrodictium delaneyi TaxID=1273541 RepID=A0A0P0N2X6_9CREN|nr:DUF1156 domain-containing protein [Pyrodictium delaneyi]ALL00908.1 hypothetical protein Pyrde_0858 [Pyrodictium delaneyi]OWJ55474.1 hypothetical protein Pdsh_01360 [Pyrodictium delaneyi]
MEPLIAHYYPTKEAGEESQRERGTRIPPPLFYLHLWWARRPLAASRATVAALAVDTNKPPDKRFVEELLQAIKLVPGLPRPAYNYSPDREWIARHSRVKEATLLDPFAGGGSIPLEALRLGFKKVVAVEYNPVAYIILKATLEYPLRYGKKLVKDVEYWAKWLVENVRRELAPYYPPHPKGRPTNYIWVRVYTCPDGKKVPSLSNPILSKDNKIALKLEGFDEEGNPILRVVNVNDVSKAKEQYATIRRKKLRCPTATLDSKELQRQYQEAMKQWEEEGRYGYHPAVLAAVKLEDGSYAEPTQEMIEAYRKAEQYLREHWDELLAEDLIPAEQIPEGEKTREVLLRGIDKFYKLFNARQLLVHAIVVKYIREAYQEMLNKGYDEDYAKAVVTYLALGHGKLLDYSSTMTMWHIKGVIGHTFARHAYTFGNDFAEGDIIPGNKQGDLLSWVFFSNTGIVKALERIVGLLEGASGEVEVVLGDAADPATYAGVDGIDFVVADPPYYDNVQYGELSDFFYVWFKRSLGELYPEAFVWDTVPKDSEIVVNRARGRDGAWFESRLRAVFELVREQGAGRLAVMYAHRSSEGLYAMFGALLGAGWKPVGVWGVAAEQPRSQHIVGKAAARSMLVIGAVPRSGGSGCFWDARLQRRVEEAVEAAVRETLGLGLGLVDAVLAGVGAAFRVAGECWPLQRLEGGVVGVREVVDLASRVASRAVTREVLRAEIDPLSTMYFLARVVYGEPEYDELRRLGYAAGLSHEVFIERFTKGSRTSRGRKVYPLKRLDEIDAVLRPGSLVEALAVAVRRFLVAGVEEALEALREAGYGLDTAVCRYVEALMADSEGGEKKALQGIYAACVQRGLAGGRGGRGPGEGSGGQRTLVEFLGRR